MTRHHSRPRLRPLIAVLLVLVTAATAPAALQVEYQTIIPGYTLASGRQLAVDGAGNAYAVASHYPDGVTLAILVVKLDLSGDVLWERVIAGTDHDQAEGIAIGADGGVWLAGWTDSPDFPRTVDALQPQSGGFREAFLLRLDPADGDLAYSTLLGGEYTDMAMGLTVAGDGSLGLVGSTWSTDFPVQDAFQPEKMGFPYDTSDFFVTRLTADGRALVHSSYLGGTGDDTAAGIALAPGGDLVVVGTTDSEDFRVYGPFQAELAGYQDGVIARVAADGSGLVASTYLGGQDLERIGGVAVAADGSVVVAGSTRSPDFPVTAGAFTPQFVGEIDGCEIPFGGDYNCPDMFAVRLVPDGGAMAYGTFLGGTETDVCRALVLDAAERPVLAGYSVSPDFPQVEFSDAAIIAARLQAGGDDLDDVLALDSGRANAGHGLALGPGGDLFLTGAGPQPAELMVVRLAEDATAAPQGAAAALRMTRVAPNPFNPRTTISLRLERSGPVEVAAYDVAGRRRATLIAGHLAAGLHTLVWQGTDDAGRALASGTYLIRARRLATDAAPGPVTDVAKVQLIR